VLVRSLRWLRDTLEQMGYANDMPAELPGGDKEDHAGRGAGS
jgi:hypothetical protein